jgi:hypothetical protein
MISFHGGLKRKKAIKLSQPGFLSHKPKQFLCYLSDHQYIRAMEDDLFKIE